jgi:hypothetical protein
MGTGVLSLGLKRGRGVKLNTHPHLVPRLRMSRNYTSSPPCAFVVCSGTALASGKNVQLSRYSDARAKGERKYSFYSFLTSALVGVSGQRHAPAVLYPWERTPGTHWIGGCMGVRAGLDTEARGKILCLCRESNPGRPFYSQTLYWLSYPSSLLHECTGQKVLHLLITDKHRS